MRSFTIGPSQYGGSAGQPKGDAPPFAPRRPTLYNDSMPARHSKLSRVAVPLVLLAGLLAPAPCSAGGGPENVLLVVNQNSEDSLTVANYYTRLRNIPPQNVLYLDWAGSAVQINGKAFRKKILQPVIDAIEGRRLVAQIDYVVYSCDLPTRVNFQDFFPDEKFPKQMRPIASITGATYLWQYVLQESPTLMAMNTNWYVPDGTSQNLAKCTALANAPSQGFRSRYAWQRGGKRTDDLTKGPRYFLSTVLGVTQEMGNSVEEIARCLVTATSADASRPDGAFYYMHNTDVRSRTRDQCFAAVAAVLRDEGAKVAVQKGMLPTGKRDVVGLTSGFRKANVPANLSVRPGAICDNLTSFGGVLEKDLGQTTLPEFIRAGAAGASGTVTEPLAIQAKFPLATIHLHYYRGCSLAEAYYQSVAAPYQLLIVGDPLCQPWADPPECGAGDLVDGKVVKGPLTLRPRLSGASQECEIYVDGRLLAMTQRGGELTIDSTKLPDGRHEVRLVAIRDDPIETRGSATAQILVDNAEGGDLTLTSSPDRRAASDETLRLRVAGDAKRGVVMQNSRIIGQLKGEPPELQVQAGDLGRGPVRLHAVDPVSSSRSAPIWVWVE